MRFCASLPGLLAATLPSETVPLPDRRVLPQGRTLIQPKTRMAAQSQAASLLPRTVGLVYRADTTDTGLATLAICGALGSGCAVSSMSTCPAVGDCRP